MPFPNIAPGLVLQAPTAALTLAADALQSLGPCPISGTVVAVLYTPIAAYVGADTNTRHWSLVNDGHTGTGGVVIANRLQNAAAGTMAIEFPQQIAITAANAHVNAGDVLKWMSTHDGTGILDPGGNVTVVVQPDLGA